MMGSFGGDGGEFFLVLLFGRMEYHLNRSMKMKAKIVKTEGCSEKDVTFVTKNCRKCNIFFSLFRASVCLSFWDLISLVDVPQLVNFYICGHCKLCQMRSRYLHYERDEWIR